MKARRSSFSLLCLAALLGAAGSSCQLLASTDVGKGIGQPCSTDGECQGGTCSKGACVTSCTTDADCPAPAQCGSGGLCQLKALGSSCSTDGECQGGTCFSSVCTNKCTAPTDCAAPAACGKSGVCELPLKVGFIYVGVPQDEGWTLTHEQGRQYAMSQLPYLQSDFVQNTFLPNDAKTAIDQFVMKGYDVIVATSFSLRDPVDEKANQYPNTKFLTCSSNVTGKNLGSYFARGEQSWYLAGYAAGSKTMTKRLGFVGSYVTPEVVRSINAFTLGALAANPAIKVEVRWVGFWFDTNPPDSSGQYAETRLANQLIGTGCDVIAHYMDNERVVTAVESAHQMGKTVYSIANDNQDACKKGPTSCIGVPYWNWGPQYVRIFEQLHTNTWDPSVVIDDNIAVNPANSITNFGVNEMIAGNDVAIAVSQKLSDLAAAGHEHKAFDGPYCSTGQRMPMCLLAGQTVTDEELHTMCWFAQGVIEKADPANPSSADQPAQVPSACQTQQ